MRNEATEILPESNEFIRASRDQELDRWNDQQTLDKILVSVGGRDKLFGLTE